MKTLLKNSTMLLALFGMSGCIQKIQYRKPNYTVQNNQAVLPPASASLIPLLEPLPVTNIPAPLLQPVQLPQDETRIVKVRNANDPKELDFDVENLTGKTVYATCFAYMRKRINTNWSWRKSPICKIEHGQTKTIDIEYIPDVQDRNFTFGYLGLFNTEEDATKAIFELLPENKMLDLDLLIKLKGKKVTLVS